MLRVRFRATNYITAAHFEFLNNGELNVKKISATFSASDVPTVSYTIEIRL